MKQLDWPAIFCHKLEVENDRITNYRLRQSNQKTLAVAAFKNLNYRVIAAGDSFNDTGMLQEANVGFFFHAPGPIQKQFPQFKAVEEYSDLMKLIVEEMKK
jgi:phosphoserine/homoserine phosphotransferase